MASTRTRKAAEVIPFPGTIGDLFEKVTAQDPDGVIVMACNENEWTMNYVKLSLQEIAYAHRIMGILLDRRAQGL